MLDQQQQSYSGRIEKSLEALQGKMDVLTEKVITLTVTNDAYKSQSEANSRDIEAIKKDVNFAKGVLWVIAFLLTLAGGSIGWAFNRMESINSKIEIQGQAINAKFEDVNRELGKTNTAVSINSSKLIRIDTESRDHKE